MFYTTLADLHDLDRVFFFLISAWLLRVLSCRYHSTRGNRKRVHARRCILDIMLPIRDSYSDRHSVVSFHPASQGDVGGGIPNYRVPHGKVGWGILNN